MEENKLKEEKLEGASVSFESGFGKRFENFWYYHKWHVLVAAFLIFALVFLSFNMCDRREFDITVIYAGSEQVSKVSDNDLPTYAKIINSLSLVVGDVSGDGESNVALSNLYYFSDKELGALTKDERAEINETLLASDAKTLSYQMMNSTYYICIFSETVFDEFVNDGNDRFVKLGSYAAGVEGVEYVTEYGIRLSSIDFGTLEGINELPSDAVICLKRQSAIADRDGSAFKMSEQAIRRILGYQK